MLRKKIIRITLYQTLWFFLIYAVLGWIIEELYIWFAFGVIVKRGFLYGPIGPIYGFGMLIVILALTPIQKRLLSLFVGATLLTTFIEYFTGALLDNIFHQRWWDYSTTAYNLHGYISLSFSLAWGLVCVFIIRLLHPKVENFVEKASREKGKKALFIAYSIVLVDFVASVTALILKKI